MSEISVRGFAQKIGVEPEKLLQQLGEAGIADKTADDMLGDDYDDWNIGVTASFFGLDFDLRYFDTTGLSGNDESVAFTVSKTF